VKKRYYKKSSSPFAGMQDAAIGMAGIGLTTGVAAGIAAQAPAGTPNMMTGFAAMGSMMPIATATYVGNSLLPKIKKKKNSIW